jgi:hypothetical protein
MSKTAEVYDTACLVVVLFGVLLFLKHPPRSVRGGMFHAINNPAKTPAECLAEAKAQKAREDAAAGPKKLGLRRRALRRFPRQRRGP